MRILVAEDDFISRRVLQQSLRRFSTDVVCATNGREAWELFEREHFSIVITDWSMPEMDGIELIRRIRAANRHAYVYIVVLTGKAQKEDVIAGMEAGADDYMNKPFHENELRARLRAATRVLELEQRLAQQHDELETAYRRLMASNDRMLQDLATAAHVQRSLLPQSHLSVPGLRIAWSFRPCEELAGDIFNVVPLTEHHVGFYVLDVSSHGVAAALLAVTLSRLLSPNIHQSLLLKRPLPHPPGYRLSLPSEVAAQLNAEFPMSAATGQYFTLLYGILHVPTNEFTFVQAGHPSPMRLSRGRAEALCPEAAGPPIGFLPEARYTDCRIALTPGDRLFLHSDGLVEAAGATHEIFGEERLLAALEQMTTAPIEETVTGAIERASSWIGAQEFTDDVSVLAVEIPADDQPGGRRRCS